MKKIVARSKEEKKAEFEGRMAMHKGYTWEDNPYRENTELHAAWRDGYKRALDEYRDTW